MATETRKIPQSQRLGKLKPLPFLLPTLIIYSIFALYPIANGLLLSFFDWDGISDERVFVGLRNYIYLFTQDPVFWTAVRNSLLWVVLSLIVPTSLGLLFALGLNQRLTGRSTLRAMIYLPSVIASIAVATIWTWMYNPILGLFSTVLKSLQLDFLVQNWLGDPDIALFSVFAAAVWHSTGVTMVLFLAGLQSVPSDLIEAARVDGANRWQVFRNVTIPALRETFIVVIVLTIIGSLKVFDLIAGMTNGGPAESTQVLAFWSFTQSFTLHEFGKGSAVAIVLLAIILVIVIPYLLWTLRQTND